MSRPHSLLRFGPGVVLAVAAAVILWPRLGAPGPVVADRSSPAASIPRPAAAPDPDWLLRRSEELGLTPSQEARLTRLDIRWQKESRPLQGALDRAAVDFSRGMSEHPRGDSLAGVQERSAAVSELSRRLSALRRSYWTQASAFLTAAQRSKAESGWSPTAAVRPVVGPAAPGTSKGDAR
jgi:hypothetical protein